MDLTLVFEQLLNGVQLGIFLFLMAAGLTLVFGIMDMMNLAHGSLYMIGAYVAASVTIWSDSFLLGLAAALPAVLLVGIAIEVIVLRTLYHRGHLDQVLATFGLILFFNELTRLIWGADGLSVPLSAFLNSSISLFGLPYSMFRTIVIGVGLPSRKHPHIDMF